MKERGVIASLAFFTGLALVVGWLLYTFAFGFMMDYGIAIVSR